MERTEMRMIRWTCGVSLKERQPSTERRRRLGVETIGDVMRRLRWHGHVERKDDTDYVIVGRWWREGTCQQAEEDQVCRRAPAKT